MSEIEIVERPQGPPRRGAKQSAESAAMLETVITGKAIRVPLNGVKWKTWRSRFGMAAGRADLVARTRIDGDHLIAWCERKTS